MDWIAWPYLGKWRGKFSTKQHASSSSVVSGQHQQYTDSSTKVAVELQLPPLPLQQLPPLVAVLVVVILREREYNPEDGAINGGKVEQIGPAGTGAFHRRGVTSACQRWFTIVQ